jgi:hypothetical protein
MRVAATTVIPHMVVAQTGYSAHTPQSQVYTPPQTGGPLFSHSPRKSQRGQSVNLGLSRINDPRPGSCGPVRFHSGALRP